MQEFQTWLTPLTDSTTLQVLSATATAVATIVLALFTWILARETKALSRASSQAHVIATVEPNQWAINYADIIVSNSGNAAAYDITLHFDPPLPKGSEAAQHREKFDTPLQRVSLLRPGQVLQSNLCAFSAVSKKTFQVKVSWVHRPGAKRREEITYTLSMMDYADVSYLGARSPLTQLAEQVKKLREDWKDVARGSKRVKADVFSNAERKEEQRHREAAYREMIAEAKAEAERKPDAT